MKILTLLLLILNSLFIINKQVPRSEDKKVISISTNVDVSKGQSKCVAKNVNPDDPQAYLPDPNCTPGILNSSVNQSNIFSTICVSGFTKTIRPPASYTDQLKIQQIQQYGYSDTNPRDYEEDHLISLELGGDPSDPKNLWPEPHPSINEKDIIENYLHKQVCTGAITLDEAQKEIIQNWYLVYQNIK